MQIEMQEEDGAWSLYVDGQRVLDRESFAVADTVRCCLKHRGAFLNTECREVADAILAQFETEDD